MSLNNTFPKKDLLQKYRNVFAHREAKEVLFSMLFDLHFFNEGTTPEDIALKNYATRLLTILGGGEIKQHSIEMLVQGLMDNPLPEDKTLYAHDPYGKFKSEQEELE